MKKLLPFLALMLYAPLALAAGVSVEGLIGLLVWLIVVGLIFWLLWWFVSYIGLPPPFDKVARVVIALVALIILLYFLLGLLGPLPRLH
jgi:hypothetical protein